MARLKTENEYGSAGHAVGVPLSDGAPIPQLLLVLVANGSKLPPCPEHWPWLPQELPYLEMPGRLCPPWGGSQ